DERPAGARPGGVERAGGELLAGARLAAQEDRHREGRGAGDLAAEPCHGEARSDERVLALAADRGAEVAQRIEPVEEDDDALGQEEDDAALDLGRPELALVVER